MTTEADPLRPLLALIETVLNERLPGHSDSELSPKLIDAMRYAVLGGGKRIRPLLTCATAISLGVDTRIALEPAAAIEFMHAYSLIHDDLPAMDDDDLRRGRPTVHIVYGDAIAILAGDALQTLAFETIARAESLSTTARLGMTEALARAAGWRGMVGGQAFDIAATGRKIPLERLEEMHRAKTGALITTAVELGALAADANDATRTALQEFGAAIGLAFQVVDDLLDATQTTRRHRQTRRRGRRGGQEHLSATVGNRRDASTRRRATSGGTRCAESRRNWGRSAARDRAHHRRPADTRCTQRCQALQSADGPGVHCAEAARPRSHISRAASAPARPPALPSSLCA